MLIALATRHGLTQAWLLSSLDTYMGVWTPGSTKSIHRWNNKMNQGPSGWKRVPQGGRGRRRFAGDGKIVDVVERERVDRD